MNGERVAPVIVSVIIAAYDAEAFVGAAVRSALDQTLPDIEVIVIDDGSRDRTAPVAAAAAMGDPRFRLFTQPVNAGVAAARNVGLRAARGRWIAVLDADDTFAPNRLERLIASAEALGADLLADNITLLYPDARTATGFAIGPRDARRPLDARRFIALDRPGLEPLPTGYMQPVMRRAFLERCDLRYPEDVACGEDFDLYVRCLLRGARLFIVPESYYRALVRPGSLSRTHQEQNMATIMHSNATLIPEALRLGDRGAARMLARRARDLRSYAEYSRLSDALHRRRFVDAARVFCRLGARAYTWRRFGMAARRRISGGNAA
ncbi:MAG TPA: glycosyltransferase family 2 protein [Candidatus Lustribacter sp.]